MDTVKNLLKIAIAIYNYFHPAKAKDPEVARLQGIIEENHAEEIERQKPVTDMHSATDILPKS